MRNTIPNDGFPCDELLASQWLDRMLPCFTDVPERRLLLAVLFDAVRCLQAGTKQRREVLTWIRGEYASARIPFQALCDGLELEAAPLARRLLLPMVSDVQRTRRVRVHHLGGGGRHIAVVEPRARPAVRLPLDPLAA